LFFLVRHNPRIATLHSRSMPMTRMHLLALAAALAPALAPVAPALAQEPKPVYRCPGPPVLYTDAMSATEAKEKACRVIEGTPVTVVPATKPRPPAPAASGAARNGEGKVDPADQRARDSDARRILAEELKREEEKLAAMRKDFNNGEPERRGDERNFQKYQDRVNDTKAAIARKESDIAAIRRELAKLPQ
jgi:hypothetical protein